MSNGFANPLNSLLRLQRALDRARGTSVFDVGTSSRGTYPPINAFREKDDYIVVCEVPGLARDELNLEVHRNRIRLTGRKSLQYGDNASIHRRERRSGAFDRTVTLPFSIDPDSVQAELRNGILAMKLSPPAEERPRTITLE